MKRILLKKLIREGIVRTIEASKPDESFFPTLDAALTSVEQYIEKNKAVLDPAEYPPNEADRFGVREPFLFGGISYEQSRNHNYKLVQFKGKPTKNRGLYVSIYRMPSGSYELTRYIS